MSKERELLERALPELDEKYNGDLIDEINYLLSKPIETPEPVAWVSSDYNMPTSIHFNADAKAWADAFEYTFPNCGVPDGVMLSWFANAMLAMFDVQRQDKDKRIAELENQVDSLNDTLEQWKTVADEGTRISNAADKRIAELERHLKTANSQTEEYERKYYLLLDRFESLEQRIANGVRVYAWRNKRDFNHWNATANNPAALMNALLLLDEQGTERD